MAAPSRREARAVFWRSPQEQSCSLTPIERDDGVVEVDVIDGHVNIHGRHCLHTVMAVDDEDAVETVMAELEMTVPLTRCQITWRYLERKANENVERSIYFKR